MRTHILVSVIAFLLCVGCAGSRTEAPIAVLVEGTGVYSRPISTDSPTAQRFFDQGLRLTWGYHFPEAVASYQEALRHDSSSPMIYWGLALALGPNPNSRAAGLPDDPLGEARRAISKGMGLIAAATDEERAFIEALNTRFDSDAYPDPVERDRAYQHAAQSVFERYPMDPDAGALVADAHMVTTPWRYWGFDGEPMPGTSAAARALENVIGRWPDHPGANHLYIHLMESSQTPERALPSADRLASLMPGVGHVVHMPGHIYIRVGQHSKSIETNRRSVAADTAFLQTWGDHAFPKIGTYFLSAENHRRHAYEFIRYSSVVRGNYAAALEAAIDAEAHAGEAMILAGPGQTLVAARWLVPKIFGRWDDLQAHERVLEGELYLDGMWHYTQGSGHVGRGEIESAVESLHALRTIVADPAAKSIRRNRNDVATLMEIAAHGLEGEIMEAQGNFDAAIAAFEAAVAIEDRLGYREPPDWSQPMRQYLGAALLTSGRLEEAETVYREDLRRNRNNGWSLFGLWQSLAAQGQADAAKSVQDTFEDAWELADVQLSRSRF
jgi:tetratricopeptide (TPR) repeat protein